MIHAYKNGNYIVKINDKDGTKVRATDDDEFWPEFPESIDVCITKKCDGGCAYCYDGATPDGRHGDLLNARFIDTLSPFTEVAINGNSLDHPELMEFLNKCKNRHLIVNITVNQKHFELYRTRLLALQKQRLFCGLGVSFRKYEPKFIEELTNFPNSVLHVINGIIRPIDICNMAKQNVQLLVLGYKDKGRGHDYLDANEDYIYENARWLKENLALISEAGFFKLIAFDNLAMDQLAVKDVVSHEQYEQFYMGEEGQFSMYIDLVNEKFGISSLCREEDMYPLEDNIKSMFDKVRGIG